MRFCKFVPLDTFSIIQSLWKSLSGPQVPVLPRQSTALTWKTSSHLLTVWKGSPAAFYLGRSLLATVPGSSKLE